MRLAILNFLRIFSLNFNHKLLTIHITNIQLNYYFFTNSSCFQLKSTLEVLGTIKFSYFCAKSR